ANINQVNALLLPSGLHPIGREVDLLTQDSYIRNLPMAYDVALDKRRRRSRLVFSRHIANLLPVYGRSRGTGHPGLVFFNRGAEPLVFDPLHSADRKKNAHMLILGPTGAGKSALLVYLLQQMLAVHRPRIFIIEAGASFSLLGQHLRFHGLTVNQVTLNPNADVSLPPFADAIKLRSGASGLTYAEESLDLDADDEQPETAGRDILGEMEIAARIMITGGDDREDARMTRADRLLIRNAIYLAAQKARDADEDQVLTEDVVAALHAIGANHDLAEHRRNRAIEMGDGMALFCSGLAGRFFNRAGSRWPAVDVTLLDMGFAGPGRLRGPTDSGLHFHDEPHQRASRRASARCTTDTGRHRRRTHHYHQSLAGTLRRQDHQDVAQARCLVLDSDAESRGLSGCQPQNAQHDGMVAVFGDAKRRDRTDSTIQRP
ncbi:MAG: FtsK/SpoIIIE domain-containing protein, partial [Pseudomonadales bacterium]